MSKPKFNPNLPYEVVASKPKFDPNQPFEVADDVSKLESALRGLAQGGSLGFADEITGALEALLTEKSYEQARDESRANYHAAQEANPMTYGAGEIGGAIGTAFIPGAGALNAGKAATFMGRAGLAAAQGGLTGLGQSEADNAKDMAIDTAKGAALGAAMQGVGEKVAAPALKYVGSKVAQGSKVLGKAGSSIEDMLLKKGAKTIANIDEDVVAAYLKNPEAINNAMTREQLAERIFGRSYSELDPEDFANLPLALQKKFGDNGVAGGLQKLRSKISEADSEAWSKLGGAAEVPKTDVLDDALHSLEAKILGTDKISGGRVGNMGVGGDAQQLKAIHDALDEINVEYGDLISESDLKKIVQALRDKAYTEAGSARSGNAAEGLKSVASSLDAVLKGANKSYAEAMLPVADMTSLESYLRGRLVDQSNPENYDKFFSQLSRWKNADDSSLFKKSIRKLDKFAGTSLSSDIDNTLAKEAFSKADTQGSRKTMLGTVAGGAAGTIFGGGPIGSVVGGMVGAGVGQYADRYAGDIVKKLLDGKIAKDQAFQLIGNKLGKYGPVLKQAAARGNNSLAATHFLLSQTDPGYRKALSKEEDDE